MPDGTYKAAPELFTKLYTIRGQKSGFTVRCLFDLLPNKRKETYIRFLTQIKAWIDVSGQPRAFEGFLLDFEECAFLAVTEVFLVLAMMGVSIICRS